VPFRPAAVAVHVEVPLAVAEDADGADAVAVPVAGNRDVARAAEVEDVVDEVGPLSPSGSEAKEALAVGGLVLGGGDVLGPLLEHVVRVGEARLELVV